MLKEGKPKKEIFFIQKQKEFETIMLKLNQEKVIALDVETSLYDSPPKLALIQISNGEKNWLFDPLKLNFIPLIKNLMENRSIVKVIHNSSFEKKVLKQYGIDILNIFDTLKISRKLRGMKIKGGHSLKTVSERELEIVMDKEQQVSNWFNRPLSFKQIQYAALDAEILIDLYNIFSSEMDQDDLFKPLEIGEISIERTIENGVLNTQKKLNSGKYYEAIVSGLDYFEKILQAIDWKIDYENFESYSKDIDKRFKKLQNLLNLKITENRLPNSLVKVISGLEMIIDGFSDIQIIDGEGKLKKHHAILVLSAIEAVSTFLNETYKYQKRRFK